MFLDKYGCYVPGVLYFGDDDNTYDLRLFEEIRDTQNISMFPVGLIGDYAVSAPVVQDVSKKKMFPDLFLAFRNDVFLCFRGKS